MDAAARARLQLPLPPFVQRLRAGSAARPRRRPRRLARRPARPPLQPLAPGRARPGPAATTAPARLNALPMDQKRLFAAIAISIGILLLFDLYNRPAREAQQARQQQVEAVGQQ